MRKPLPLLLSLALFAPASVTYARQLTPSQALERAISTNPSRAVASESDFSLSYTVTAPSTSAPGVYVFTRPGGGFVMVSADDNAEALLGYSDTAEFSPESISPSLAAWMQEYASQVEWAATHPATPSRAAESRPDRAAISPLLPTLWNQTAPYNNNCPTLTTKNQQGETYTVKAPTGCVATSTAQVMRYHKYPEKGNGSISYTYKTPYDGEKSNSFDFSATTFDWDNMIGSYTAGSYTDAQAAAVATLMQATGAAVQMEYGPSESSASPIVQWQAMYTYLGYSKSAAFNNRSWYGLYDWEDLIYNTLKNDGPAILGGQSGTGGHSFVCDGYQGDGYFHINWGWAGMSDGYFLLTALNPASQGTGGSEGGYNFDQDAITGIRKPSGDDEVNYQMSASNIQLGSGTNRQLPINYTWSNYSSATLNNVKIGVRIDGKDYWNGTNIASIEPSQGMSFQNLATISLSGIAAGSYKAYPIYKCDEVPDGALMKTNITTEPYINLTVDNSGNVSASMSVADITVGAFTFDTQFYIGQQFSFSVKITNSGSLEYASPVTAILKPSGSTEATELSEYALDLMPGESETATFTGTLSTDLAAGTYQLYLANVTSNGEVTLLSDPTNVTLVQGAAPMISITSVTIESPNSVDPENIKITYTVTNAGGPFAGSFNVLVFPGEGGYNLTSFPSPIISVPANSNSGVTFTMTGKFPQASPNTKYFLVFYSGKDSVSQQIVFTTAPTTGIESVGADTPAGVTAIYTVSGQLLPATDPASLAPGLYILVTPQGPVKYLAR